MKLQWLIEYFLSQLKKEKNTLKIKTSLMKKKKKFQGKI